MEAEVLDFQIHLCLGAEVCKISFGWMNLKLISRTQIPIQTSGVQR